MNRTIYILAITLFPFYFLSAQTICIDPGHGFGENGENTDGRSLEEIYTNVAVGLYLRDSLETKGYTVIMTRESNDTGSWMSLTQRAELADYYESERLLSIHCNACNSCGATGTETFWSSRNTTNVNIDRTFSDLVQKHMVNIGEWRNRRSAEDSVYFGFRLGVLKGYTPGCLNEIGFVDTPSDLKKLLDEEWRQKFAHAYVLAIDESFTLDYPPQTSQTENSQVGINVYPNPFTDHLNIELNDSKIYISLFNIDGKAIFNNILCNGYVSNLSALETGIYILHIETGSNHYVLKVLKK